MATRVSSPTFVGRQPELERARAALGGAATGSAAIVVVAGEAGVGKTRFVHEIATTARASGARVLEGGCLPLGGEGLPFGAVIEALRGLQTELAPSEMDGLIASGRAELVRLMPDLAPDDWVVPDRAGIDATSQGRLFEHLLRFLERLAARGPLIVLIEDIHWADRSTLELLDFLARNLRHRSIALLATYRSDELQRGHPLVQFLAELERSGRAERLALARFDREELALLIEGILGQVPEPELVDRLVIRSDGNAFYAEELLRSGRGEGDLPDTLREVLLARAAGLSEPTQRLLRVASAGGPRVRTALVAAAIGTSQQELLEQLRQAVDHQLLVPVADSMGEQFVFRHALIQEAVYDDLLPGERVRLHEAFARAIADGADGDSNASRAAELAFHWQAAGDLPRALDGWIDAGIASESIAAFAEAGAHFERSLELWDRIPGPPVRAGLDRVDLHARAAAALEGSAPSRSVEHIRSALDLVDQAAEPMRAGLLHVQLGDYLVLTEEDEAGFAAYREAVALVPAEPSSAARSTVLAELGRCCFYLNRQAEAASLCEEAVQIARAVGARREEGRALIPLALILAYRGEVESSLADLRRARDLSSALGDSYGVSRAMTNTASVLGFAARYEEAVAVAFEAEAHAARNGLTGRFGSSDLVWGAKALLHLGRWNEAMDALRREQLLVTHDAEAVNVRLMFEALRGDFEAAHATKERWRSAPRSPFFAGFRMAAAIAELALWERDPLSVREITRSETATFDAHGEIYPMEVGEACWLGLRAEADLAALARRRRSAASHEAARENGASLISRIRTSTDEVAALRRDYLPQIEAWQAMCEAEYARLVGPPDPDAWGSAVAAWEALGHPYHRAYALMREGEAAIAGHRDRPRATGVLSDARRIAVQLGAEPLRQAIDALVQRSGTRVADRRSHRLSRREREVLGLVAAGRSNAEIGDALFISKKTASVHVANIKAKLGAASRVNIVTSAISLGLVDSGPIMEEARQVSADFGAPSRG